MGGDGAMVKIVVGVWNVVLKMTVVGLCSQWMRWAESSRNEGSKDLNMQINVERDVMS